MCFGQYFGIQVPKARVLMKIKLLELAIIQQWVHITQALELWGGPQTWTKEGGELRRSLSDYLYFSFHACCFPLLLHFLSILYIVISVFLAPICSQHSTDCLPRLIAPQWGPHRPPEPPPPPPPPTPQTTGLSDTTKGTGSGCELVRWK